MTAADTPVRTLGRIDPTFWRGRRVLLTGHTGFKGAWLAAMLCRLGARVTGLALPAEAAHVLWPALASRIEVDSRLIDMRDSAAIAAVVSAVKPEIVLHLAAQALVGRGYREPAATFAANLDGTIHLLQALRGRAGLCATLVVTSDKVYRNDGSGRAFVESDPLGGDDPYSASKAACEIAVASWRASFGAEIGPIVTARAGNVVGGGDFGEARLAPDIVAAARAGRDLVVRYPDATRPWQHVLDVCAGYLLYAQAAAQGNVPNSLNFGPAEAPMTVRRLIDVFGAALGAPVAWRQAPGPLDKEAPALALDPSAAETALGWRRRFSPEAGLNEAARWYRCWIDGDEPGRLTLNAVDAHLAWMGAP